MAEAVTSQLWGLWARTRWCGAQNRTAYGAPMDGPLSCHVPPRNTAPGWLLRTFSYQPQHQMQDTLQNPSCRRCKRCAENRLLSVCICKCKYFYLVVWFAVSCGFLHSRWAELHAYIHSWTVDCGLTNSLRIYIRAQIWWLAIQSITS